MHLKRRLHVDHFEGVSDSATKDYQSLPGFSELLPWQQMQYKSKLVLFIAIILSVICAFTMLLFAPVFFSPLSHIKYSLLFLLSN